MKKILFLILSFLPVILLGLNCSICHKNIRGNYLKNEKGVYCSRSCFHRTLPRCSNCRRPCESQISLNGKIFCSESCMKKVFRCSVCYRGVSKYYTVTNPLGKRIIVCDHCRNVPSCFYCQMPTRERALSDGRRLCRSCRADSITDPGEVNRIFRQVRRDLARYFRFDAQHRITLKIVDAQELNRAARGTYAPGNGSRRMSLMQYQQKIMHSRDHSGKTRRRVVGEKCTILILHTMPRAYLQDVFAHELTHDHLRHNVGKVDDLTSEEGFCELVASLYNQRIGNGKYNLLKEANPDPVYGGGYRKMKAIYTRTGRLNATMRHVR